MQTDSREAGTSAEPLEPSSGHVGPPRRRAVGLVGEDVASLAEVDAELAASSCERPR